MSRGAERESLPARFWGKTWIFVAQEIIFGGMAGFCLLLIVLLTFVAKPQGAADAAKNEMVILIMFVMGLVCLSLYALAWFNIQHRREPILALYQEGIEYHEIGGKRIPLLPGWFHVAWEIVSGRGFRHQLVRIPWSWLRGASVWGLPMDRVMTLEIEPPGTKRPDLDFGLPHGPLSFPQVMFKERLERIVAAIDAAASSPPTRLKLPSWDEE